MAACAREADARKANSLVFCIAHSMEAIILLMLWSLRCGQRLMPCSRQIFLSTVVHTPRMPASGEMHGVR